MYYVQFDQQCMLSLYFGHDVSAYGRPELEIRTVNISPEAVVVDFLRGGWDRRK
jgi:hypothetical protein